MLRLLLLLLMLQLLLLLLMLPPRRHGRRCRRRHRRPALPPVWHTGTLYNVAWARQTAVGCRLARCAALYIIKGQTGRTRK